MSAPAPVPEAANTETTAAPKTPKALQHPLTRPEDSALIAVLHKLAKKSPKLVKPHAYVAPADPDITVNSWKMNEFKYYDIPSPFPTLARGIFTYEVDREDGETGPLDDEHRYRIVARGYDKFFNIGEVPWTTWASITDHTAAPYTLSLKSNGCIIFIGALTPSKLLVTSKHSVGAVQGVEKSHAQAGEEWLRKYFTHKGKTEEELAKRLWDNNWTAIAELCDDSFEEHVLPYPPELTGLHLHGLNACTKDFATLSHSVVDEFAEEWGFIRTKSVTLNSVTEVQEFTDQVSKTQHWEGEAVEGFVVRTHVTQPPDSRGESKRSDVSPYAPDSSFFFKVKFDEPYMMYRDWREVTKMLLNQRGRLHEDSLPRNKMKRPETKKYVKWVIQEIKRDRKQFDGFAKGKGIIATRERFLRWLESNGEGLSTTTSDDAETGQQRPEEFGKTIIVPVAIPGCGKTTVAVALAHIFGFGHTQSDDVQAKKAAPVFLKNVNDLLKKHDVVIADKNNHLKQHRAQLHEIARSLSPPARLIALNWALDKPQSTIHRVCGDRVLLRGDNHQTLRADVTPGKSHETVLWQFITNTEALADNEVDDIIDMDFEEDFSTSLQRAITGICETLKLKKPTPEKVKEGLDVALGYKAKTRTTKDEMTSKTKTKDPRYFALLPEVKVDDLIHKVLGEDDTYTLWKHLYSTSRVTQRPHVTLVHQKGLPGEIELWERCMEIHGLESPPVFELRLGNVVWNDRVMAICVDDIKLEAEASQDKSQKGEEFISKLRDDVRLRLHITVGTKDDTIPPVEAKDLVEKWRAGDKEGLHSLQFEPVTVKGRVKGPLGFTMPSSIGSSHDKKDGFRDHEGHTVEDPSIGDGESFDRVPQKNRRLGTVSAVMLVANRMIGTGIFATPAGIVASTGSIGLALFLWLIGGIIAAAGLTVYLEWATALPRSGGEKNYLEFSYHRPLYLITCVYAITGEMLLNATNTEVDQWNQRGIGLGVVTFALIIHGCTPKTGIYLQNVLGFFKIVVLLFIICTGFAALAGRVPGGSPHNFTNAFAGTKVDANSFVQALYNVIWSFIGYSNAFYAMSEIRNPIRTVKRAAPLAMILVTVLYILTNVAYFAAVPKETILTSKRLLAAEFFGIMFGEKANKAISVLIALSAIGNVLAVLFGQGRINQELGREGVLPFSKFFASNKPFDSPLAGLGLQWLVTVIIILGPPPGDAYNFLLNLISYPLNVFNALVSFGLLWIYFNKEKYNWNPPVKATLPVVILFALANVFLVIVPLVPPSAGNEPYESLPYWLHVVVGFGVLAAGGLYWVIWAKLLPKLGNYHLVREQEVASDGLTRNVFRPISVLLSCGTAVGAVYVVSAYGNPAVWVALGLDRILSLIRIKLLGLAYNPFIIPSFTRTSAEITPRLLSLYDNYNGFYTAFRQEQDCIVQSENPDRGGQAKLGVDNGPIHLVEAGLIDQLKELEWNVKFDGHHQFEEIAAADDPPIGKLKNPRLVSKVCESVAKVVGGHAKNGELPLTLGGDHSLAMGTISGTLEAHPDACVVWVDAHADINTYETTDSGNIHGMPVSFLIGIGEKIDEFAWVKPALKANRIVYIGLRDVDSGEKRILRENNIKAFSMHQVDKYGIGKVVEMALDHVNPNRDLPIHLSFDVDALDPSVAPSTGTPVRGGLSFREGHYICEALWETGLLAAVDIMEVNPSLADGDGVEQTVAVGCSLARSALGETLL
ncbi:tRNA ligase [Marasmius crinis-equi]|uniref:arginase n=1 Tax=Marasmius crinis-equi TaxID=585013 RepID=A0ABR3FZX9_9AGAR